MNILSRIVETKRAEVARMTGEAFAPTSPRASFVEAVRRGRPAIIAEIKPKSPSAGQLLMADRVPSLVDIYDRSASAISVLCDKPYFGGGFELLASVAHMTDKPLLAKEFVIDRRQIALAVANGASSVLLIAAILDSPLLAELIGTAAKRRCDVLLEVHDEADVEKTATALESLAESSVRRRVVVGVNNRNLDTLAVDLRQTELLAPIVRERLGEDIPIIAESGIESPDDCRRLSPLVDGFLVGTSILRSPDPADFLQSLVMACNH